MKNQHSLAKFVVLIMHCKGHQGIQQEYFPVCISSNLGQIECAVNNKWRYINLQHFLTSLIYYTEGFGSVGEGVVDSRPYYLVLFQPSCSAPLFIVSWNCGKSFCIRTMSVCFLKNTCKFSFICHCGLAGSTLV